MVQANKILEFPFRLTPEANLLSSQDLLIERAKVAFLESQEATKQAIRCLFEAGKYLYLLREDCGSRNFKPLIEQSEVWGHSYRQAYTCLNIYEAVKRVLGTDADSPQVADLLFQNIAANITTFRDLCAPKNEEVAKTVLEKAIKGKVDKEEITEALKEQRRKIRAEKVAKIDEFHSHYIADEAKTGCSSCVYYKREKGRQECTFHRELLRNMPTLDQEKGCSELTTSLEDDSSALQVSELAWTKLITFASKRRVSVEDFANKLILDAASEIEAMSKTIESQQAEIEAVKAANYELTQKLKELLK